MERAAASPHLPAEEDVNQSVGQTTINQAEEQSGTGQDQMQPRLKTNDWMLQQPAGHSLQLEFQDSNLSPALSLLPVTSGVDHNFPEYSLFQQSDTEFAPLRAYPDISMASERFHFPSQDHTAHVSECDSLSQHPLTQATILSEEGDISCSSISQHSLSPREKIPSADDNQGIPPREETGSRIKEPETRTNPPDKPEGELVQDETFFLSKDVRAQHLLELLQKDVGVPDSSSSAVSSSSETSVKSTLSFTEGHMAVREGPPGEASLPLQQRQQHGGVSNRGQSRAPSSEVCNITMGSRSTQPDESSEELHRELLSEAESKNKQLKSPTPPDQPLTPSEDKPSVIRSNLSDVPWTGPFSAGVERIHREQDLWLSGNQTGIDGSYLGFLPQSQSTPGFFKAPPKPSVKTKLGQLSAIESSKESSNQSSTGTSPPPAVPVEDAHGPETAHQGQEDGSSEKVQSLPSLNYIQKVDAWRANQSAGKTSLFDSLALQGFSGISPKKKAYEAVSDKLNRILSQQVRSLQQPLVSGSDNHNVPQSSSATLSALSSPRRGEAVGSTPSDMDNTGSAPLSASPYGRSQSHSSLNTVVMSAHKDQQTDRPSEKDKTHSQDHHHHHPSTSLQPANLMSLGHFSDVSLDRDSALSSSQDSYRGVKLGASVGASSVVSLEIDNYVPHWTSKLSTSPPLPKSRELNIDERIPLYLRNLGIDQSPSTILTPFAPRGPIREPEFSPTDLCTIKGSIGTPTKSAQPSEGSSPHKSEFSRSSIVSVDSTISIPFSLDSLGPAVSIPERTRRTTPPSDTEAVQRKPRLAVLSQSEEDSHSSILQNIQQQQQDSSSTSSQNISEPGDKFDVSLSVKERNTGSLLQTSRSLDQSVEDSFVSSKALLEIRKLLSHADNVVSSGSSAASSASHAAPHPLSDEDVLKKTSRLLDSSFSSSSSSSAGDLRTRSSQLWTRSSSDSVLTSEKLRQSSVGRESMTSSWQPDYQSKQDFIAAPTTITPKTPQDGAVSTGAGVSLVLSKSARRTEPEGCSAAPPDTIPTQPPVIQPLLSTQQLTSTPVDAAQITEEEEEEEKERTTLRSPVQSVSPSPVLEESDQGVMSDESSGSSLAVRVAKLLQSESSATMMSSTPSVTDQEDNKAREWIKLKVSGQQCEPLELDKEDRKRIEEIKKELLLKNPMTSQSSTDTETSAASSARVPRENNQTWSADIFASNQPLLGPSTNPPHSTTEHLHQDLEAKVSEIAAREGVNLPTKTPRAFTSITISTCRRSTSPSPSTSPAPPLSPAPEPLHLTELSTDKPPVDEEERVGARSSLHPRNVISLSAPEIQERRDAVGGQFEEPPPVLNRDDVTKHDGAQSFRRDDKLSINNVTSPGHVSHVHLTLSPKVTDHASSTRVHSSHAPSWLPREEPVPVRHSSSAASSPDEGVGLSSPPEWYETRRPSPDKPDTAALFKPVVPQERTTAQSLTPRHTPATSPRPFTTETPVPALLPYKPHGSEELFYVPQTEADVSDTTMESSHTGSDDAVPPHFSSEVLGRRDPGLDRGVTIKHVEGIYSKRLKTASFKMNERRHRGADKSSPGLSQTPKPSSQVSSVAFTRVPLLSNQEVSKRDQGTSPIQFQHYDQSEPSRGRFERLHVLQTSVPQRGREGHQSRRGSDLHESSFQQRSSSALDQLWQRFCDQWTTEESRPTRDREESLIERLERLSRLIHSTRPTNVSGAQEEAGYHPEDKSGWRREDVILRRTKRKEDVGEVKRSLHGDERGHRRVEPSQPEEDDSRVSSSTFSHSSSHSLHLSPADRDESSETLSGSVSTVDTARLIRAFGADRVQRLKTTPSLSKLYGTINRQKEGREQRRGRNTPPLILTPSDTTGTDESVAVADSASSTSTYTRPSHRGPSRTLAAKKAVKLINKGVQAGDLEIVKNGTRRHTRDVGTTFPSPGEARALGQISPSSSSGVRGRGGHRSPSKTQGVQKLRKSRRSPSHHYPKGVSWFISADNLRSEARKENQPEEASRPSTVWFEPYSRMRPWREPLRQRRVLEDRNEQLGVMRPTEPEPTTKTTSSGLARVSLQEALEMSRPEFLSRSRQRVKRLALQAEERKLQAVFTRERDDVFNQLGRAERLWKPAGTALIRRAVPRKEMIQRSKQIYENLPEVQRRREEARRKAEYESYRLNAQLYNKRITNRVLGRRSAWQ